MGIDSVEVAMKVTVVDNDAALLRSLAIVLCGEGHQVDAHVTPRAALAAIDAGMQPDVLIVDYRMPEMNGLEFLKALSGRLAPGCRTILISGHTDQIAERELDAAGVDAYLPKPIDLSQLHQQLDGCARQRDSKPTRERNPS